MRGWLIILLVFTVGICSAEVPYGISSQLFARPGEKGPAGAGMKLPPEIIWLKTEKRMVSAGIAAAIMARKDLALDLLAARRIIVPAYEAMDKDPAFKKLPVMLPGTTDFKKAGKQGHYFMYVPKAHRAGQEATIILFLHGFGGNFKLYAWLWKDICAQHGWILICPTFGMGMWTNPGADVLVKGALKDGLERSGAEQGKVILAGVSGGSAAVTDLAGKGIPHDGMVFISGGSLDLTVLKEDDRSPALILAGKNDWAYDAALTTKWALASRGHQAEMKTYADQSHFLLATHRKEVMEDTANWMQKELKITLKETEPVRKPEEPSQAGPIERPAADGEDGETPRYKGDLPAIHTIEKGETLLKIAEFYYGDGQRFRDIVKVNPGLNPFKMIVGQKLTIPALEE